MQSKFWVVYDNPAHPNLVWLFQVAEGCKNLKLLHLNQCNKVTDAGVIALAQNCPRLRQLLLDHCDKVRTYKLWDYIRWQFFRFLHKTIWCGYSLKSPWQGDYCVLQLSKYPQWTSVENYHLITCIVTVNNYLVCRQNSFQETLNFLPLGKSLEFCIFCASPNRIHYKDLQ